MTFVYDARGNLTSDGRRTFAYDDEGQLASITITNEWKTEFAYDGFLRRRLLRALCWSPAGWVETNVVRYIYDGNLVAQERNIHNLAQSSFTRGTDLHGDFQSFGGIGGLLARTPHRPFFRHRFRINTQAFSQMEQGIFVQ